MALKNVSNIARRAQYTAEDAASEAEAIRSGLDPMLRSAEVQSGMVSGANVLPNRLLPEGGMRENMATYYEALATRLPGYVNARRAYEDALKKKEEQDKKANEPKFEIPKFNLPMTYLQSPQYYLPQAALVPDIKRDTMYVTSPYGAMPVGTVSGKPTPAQRVLAQRKYSRTKTEAM